MSFCTIFSYVNLWWYHDNLGWKYCLLFKLRRKKLFWTNKKFVYWIFINKLSWYHPKIKYIRKFHTKWHEYVTNVNRWLVGRWSTYFVNAPLNRLLPPHGGRPCSCVHFFPSPSELFCLKNEFPLLPSLDPSLLLLLQVPLQRNPGHCLNPASITLKNV